MANPVSPELVDFLQHAGIRSDHPIVLYMTHIGLTSETAFVEFRPDSADLLAWCDKFKSEIKFGAHKIGPIEGDHLDALKASLVAAHKAINKSITPINTSAPPTGLPTPPATTHKDTDDKIPKTLPPGVYNELVEQYNKVTIHGQRRAFPEKQLLGAEKIIARMWHEHNKSKCYTAVTLGELLQHRHFTATGNINSRINDKKHETILTIDSESKTLVEKNKADWDPHTLLMVMDGLEAIKWAWILIHIGEETDIQNYIQRFEQLVRRHADRIPQVKEAWNTFSWQLAMQMRSGVTFKEASADILQDTIQLTDILSQPASKRPRNDRSPKGKGKGKYKSDRQPFRPIRTPRRFDNQPYQQHPTANHRIASGNNRHHGRHSHINNSGNPTLHPHPPGHQTPDHRTRIPRDTSLRAKGGRRANPPPAGNRDNTERRPQRLRHPRCPASNSCSSPSYQTHLSSTSASLTASAQHPKHSSSSVPT